MENRQWNDRQHDEDRWDRDRYDRDSYQNRDMRPHGYSYDHDEDDHGTPSYRRSGEGYRGNDYDRYNQNRYGYGQDSRSGYSGSAGDYERRYGQGSSSYGLGRGSGDYGRSSYRSGSSDYGRRYGSGSGSSDYGRSYGSGRSSDYGRGSYGSGRGNDYGYGQDRTNYGYSENRNRGIGRASYYERVGDDYGRRDFDENRPGYGSHRGPQGRSDWRRSFGYGGSRYGSADYGRDSRDYGRNRGDYGSYSGRSRDYDRYASDWDEDRNWWDRTTDEVASWFGDDDARRRREMDEIQDHRGKGVKGYQRSDDKIKSDLEDDYYHDSLIDPSDMTVSVSDGKVTLEGTVDSKWASRRAEDMAEEVSGVKDVVNNLTVKKRDSSSSYTTGSGTGSSTTGATGATTGNTGIGSTGTADTSDTSGPGSSTKTTGNITGSTTGKKANERKKSEA